MPIIRITAEAHQVIRRQARNPGPQITERKPNNDGTYDIPLGFDVIAKLKEIKQEEESFSDLIIRLETMGIRQ